MPKKKIDYAKIGTVYGKNGGNLKAAMEAGGFASTSAQRGMDSMSIGGKGIFEEAAAKAVEKNNQVAIRLSKRVDTENLRHIARGGLIRNAGERTDKAISTLKTIATLAETSMINPEALSGVLIIQAARIPSFQKLDCGCYYEPCQCAKPALPAVEAR